MTTQVPFVSKYWPLIFRKQFHYSLKHVACLPSALWYIHIYIYIIIYIEIHIIWVWYSCPWAEKNRRDSKCTPWSLTWRSNHNGIYHQQYDHMVYIWWISYVTHYVIYYSNDGANYQGPNWLPGLSNCPRWTRRVMTLESIWRQVLHGCLVMAIYGSFVNEMVRIQVAYTILHPKILKIKRPL